MRKKSLLALLLALMLILSGCSLVTVDKAADEARIIVDVNGETVTKKQISNAVSNTISQNEYMNQIYSMFGMTANYPTDEATIIPQVIEAYVENLVTTQKAKALGMDQMTEEEEAHYNEHLDSEWKDYLSQIASYYFPSQTLEGEELEAEAQKYIEQYGLSTKDDLAESVKSEEMLEKLKADTIKDVAVTEEELQEALNTKVAADQETYTASPEAYGSAVNNGTTVYYAPAGYRLVKHILVKFEEADQTAIDEKEKALSDAQTALTTANSALESPAEDADKDALQAAVTEAEKAVEDANAAVTEATETAYANILEKTNEILAKAKAEGADFDALVQEFSGDKEGMPAAGYAIKEGFTDFVEAFVTAGMGLEKVGDVSDLVKSTYGYHIIQYAGDVQEGPVSLDAVRETLEKETLETKQETTYNEAVQQWIKEADVKTYPEKMN